MVKFDTQSAVKIPTHVTCVNDGHSMTKQAKVVKSEVWVK